MLEMVIVDGLGIFRQCSMLGEQQKSRFRAVTIEDCHKGSCYSVNPADIFPRRWQLSLGGWAWLWPSSLSI